MAATDPQFLYMALILPVLFGITLLGEGISKLFHEEGGGWINIIFGFTFLVIVVFAFLLLTSLLKS